MVGTIITWALGLLGLALGTWGAFKAKETPGKVVSGLTGLVFLAVPIGLTIWQAQDLKPHYTSLHGVKVRQGTINHCKQQTVEAWTGWTLDFWDDHCDADKLAKLTDGFYVYCFDSDKLSSFGRAVRGVSHGDRAAIGWNGKLTYTRSLFIHELSHRLMPACGVPPGIETTHHAYFTEKKLGH